MKSYSEDLRRKIVDAVEQRGTSNTQATRLSEVSLSSVKRYSRMVRQGNSLAPKKRPGRTPKADEKVKKLLHEHMEERPTATIAERIRFLQSITGECLSYSTIPRLSKRLGWSRKKECGCSRTDEWPRAAWRVTLAQRIDPQRPVFVDEMGAHTSLSPIYAYSPKGQRAYCSVPLNRGPNTTLPSCMSVEGMEASLVVEGATDRDAFEVYVERVLSPEPRPGQVVVMDNLTAHKGERGRELIEGRGCELLYLQPYSPDFNPIEEAFAEIKGLLRKAEARTREALVEAVGIAISAVSAQDARGFFEHCGYRPQVQLL